MHCKKDEANIYTLKYDVGKLAAGGVDNVSLYAEISNNSPIPEQGDYMLDIFLVIEPLAFRNHVVGLPFGEKSMPKSVIDNYVDSIVSGRIIDDKFHLLVNDMMLDADDREKATDARFN